jgi:hypothetical protein
MKNKMKTYTATSQNSRNFILENENHEILGELIYQNGILLKQKFISVQKFLKLIPKVFGQLL